MFLNCISVRCLNGSGHLLLHIRNVACEQLYSSRAAPCVPETKLQVESKAPGGFCVKIKGGGVAANRHTG